MTEEQSPQPWSVGFRAGFGTWLGFALVALVQALFIAFFLPRPATGNWIRIQQHLFDACGILGVGLAAGFVVGAGVSLVTRQAWSGQARKDWRTFGFVAYAGVALAIMSQLLGYEVERTALSHLGGRFWLPQFVVGMLLLGLSVPTVFLLGWWANRRSWSRIAALVVGAVVLIINYVFLRDDYAGFHGALAWTATSVVAMPLVWVAEKIAAKLRPLTRKRAAGMALACSLFGLIVPPSATVRVELFRAPAAISAWFFAATLWKMPGDTPIALPPEVVSSPYYQPREKLAPTPPTSPPLLPEKSPIIVLITIDATRADAIERPKNEEFFPTLARLKRESAYFVRVTSPGAQTAVALSTVFSGRYFSQLEWRKHGDGKLRFLYPAADPSLRFPGILSQNGVQTATYCGITFLSGEYGVTRGFSEETIVVKGRDHAKAEQILTPLLERLEHAGNEPLFLYAHLVEPHAPYDRGGKEGSVTHRYLQEIGVADEAVGQLLKVLQERYPDRGYLFVSSDHGEAFGEHGTTKHGKTVYEELLRVPLFVYGPGVVPRRIEEHVTTVDLGPTILDMFGLDTPPTFMGQSLVPLLAGRDVRLTRPILAEGRMRRVLYWGNWKIIDDPRRKTVEAFDLEHDPRELRNRFDTNRAHVMPALGALRHFFEVHQLRRQGYEIPYKP